MPRPSDDDQRDEAEHHLAMLAGQARASGMSAADAAAAARRKFGNPTAIQEDVRAVHVNQTVENLLRDIRYAVRGFRSNRGFALAVIFAAALGIGPTTAVFSVIDRILFRPLPYAHEDRLVSVGMMTPLDTNEFLFASPYFGLRRRPAPFEAVSAFQAGSIPCDLTENNPLRLRCLRIERNFLDVFGIQLAAGRSFLPEEDVPNGPRVALISHGLWLRRFGGDPQAVGRTLPLDGAPALIVGVLPIHFEMPTLTEADILLPLALDESRETAGRAFRVFARLPNGLTAAQARLQMQPYFNDALQTVPPAFRKEIGFQVRPVRDRQVGDAKLASAALFGSVLAVLLIACANIATLVLARAVGRARELAMRAALGASRLRLAAQSLTECVLLALAGGAAGVALTWALLRGFTAMAPGALPRMAQASIDWRVLIFTAVLSVASGVVFGVVPAFRNPPAALIGGAWRAVGTPSGRLRTLLVMLQIAVTIVLLAGAGLLLRSLWNISRVPLGIDAGHVVTARFVLGKGRYPDGPREIAFTQELERRLAALPGVEVAAIADSLPPAGGTRGRPLNTIEVEGRERKPEGTGGMVAWRFVSPGYFAALRIPILRGRGFSAADLEPSAYSMIMSDSFARAIFPGQDPIGKRLLRGPKGEWFTVIGVAGDVKNSGPARPAAPEYYVVRKPAPDLTYANQEPPVGWRAATALVRTSIDPKLVTRAVRETIASLDPTLPVDIETMRQRTASVLARPRFNASLLALFAGIGVLLAAVGLYGVVAFLVGQRRHEIGVRIALGATPPAIVALVLGQIARWTVAGVVVGVVGSLFAARALRTLLFGVPERDPITVSAVVLFLGLVAAAAAWLPTRRAARLDPLSTLREN